MNVAYGKILGVAFVLTLAGCASRGPVGGADGLTIAPKEALPQPTSEDYRAASRPYYVGAFDKLKVDVFGVEDLVREVQVDAAGNFTFPLIGTVAGAGHTPEQIARDIEGRLRGRYVRNPFVTVNLSETVSQVVTVDGQVNKPGQYAVIGKMTLIQAIARAEGTAEFARTQEVVVFRTVNGQRYAGIYDIGAIRRGNYPDPEIFSNDVIVVGDSQAKRLFKTLIQAGSLITAPLIILLQRR